jgi:hypothetical protein
MKLKEFSSSGVWLTPRYAFGTLGERYQEFRSLEERRMKFLLPCSPFTDI